MPDDLARGERVGEYVVEERLGEGGFGAVYRAVQPVIGKQVAVKVLHRKYSADPAALTRFVDEARSVNRIGHANIVDIFAFGALDDGRHYHVMELLHGRTLEEVLAERGKLPLDEAMPLLDGIARALDAAHRGGVAHRDLKPANVFVVDGEARLIDFGMAKLLDEERAPETATVTGTLMGTPHYMSPEQCRGRPVGHRTDIYSFGVVAYRTLTGALPFTGEDPLDILVKHTTEPPPRAPGVPAHVDRALRWMLEKKPERRPPDLASAMKALAELTPARPRWIWPAALVAALAIMAAVIAWPRGTTKAPATTAPSPAPAAVDAGVPVDAVVEPAPSAATDAAPTPKRVPPKQRPPGLEDVEDPFHH